VNHRIVVGRSSSVIRRWSLALSTRESCWIESLIRYRKDPTIDDRSYCFGGAGFAGWLWVGEDFSFCSTDAGPLLRVYMTESVMDVTMKMMAHQVVALVSTVAALSSFYPEAKDIHDPENRLHQIVRLIAKVSATKGGVDLVKRQTPMH